MVSVAKVYGGQSAEHRELERRERLLAAGLDLLGSSGFAATTVHAVCAEAGLSQRYFYESFASREALVLAVVRRIYDAMRDAIAATLAGEASPDERLHGQLAAFVGLMLDDPRQGRAALVESAGLEGSQRVRHQALMRFARGLAAQSAAVRGSVPDARDELRATMVVGGLFETMIGVLHGEIAIDRAELVEQLAAFVRTSLGWRAAPVARVAEPRATKPPGTRKR